MLSNKEPSSFKPNNWLQNKNFYNDNPRNDMNRDSYI